MPRKKTHIDLHVRFEIEDLKEIDKIVIADDYDSRTDFIREAVKRHIADKKGELVRQFSNAVAKQVQIMQAELRTMLTLCWRAAAESMYIDLEIYRQSTPRELSENEWVELRKQAKSASALWANRMEEASAIDLAQLKFSPAREGQMPMDGIPMSEVQSKKGRKK